MRIISDYTESKNFNIHRVLIKDEANGVIAKFSSQQHTLQELNDIIPQNITDQLSRNFWISQLEMEPHYLGKGLATTSWALAVATLIANNNGPQSFFSQDLAKDRDFHNTQWTSRHIEPMQEILRSVFSLNITNIWETMPFAYKIFIWNAEGTIPSKNLYIDV